MYLAFTLTLISGYGQNSHGNHTKLFLDNERLSFQRNCQWCHVSSGVKQEDLISNKLIGVKFPKDNQGEVLSK